MAAAPLSGSSKSPQVSLPSVTRPAVAQVEAVPSAQGPDRKPRGRPVDLSWEREITLPCCESLTLEWFLTAV